MAKTSYEIDPGMLRCKVTLQYPTDTANNDGTVTVLWLDKGSASTRAAVYPVSADEYEVAQQQHGRITHRVVMRYYADVTTRWRLSYDGRYLDIVSVINVDERNRIMELLCRENIAGAYSV